MEPNEERESALSVAARSIATRMGVAETVVDVLRGRALRHFAEGLRQYMAIRVGSADDAAGLLKELRTWVGSSAAETLVEEPGPRARLYKQAREMAFALLARRSGNGSADASGSASASASKQ